MAVIPWPKHSQTFDFFVERETGPLDNESVINWCNECNIDIGAHINIPAPTYQIALNTTDLDYPLPAYLKQINRLWLQSEYDNGINCDLDVKYRIYNGRIHFPVPFPMVDTNVARSQAEIQANMNANLTGNELGLVGLWKFNEGYGTLLRDFTANHNHGTINGATRVVV